MRNEIKASFKQATIKGGTATLQFEVLPSAKGFMDAIKMAGSVVLLTIENEQQELPLDEEQPSEGQTTISNYFVNVDTGEISEYEEPIEAEIIDDSHALPEGGEE